MSDLIVPEEFKKKDDVPKAGDDVTARIERADGKVAEMPYFAVEVRTFTDSVRPGPHQIIQRVLVLGTPPPDFTEFQGIGDYEFVIPDTEPAQMSSWRFPFSIHGAKTIQEAYAMFTDAMNSQDATTLAYAAFKVEVQQQRAEYEARRKASEIAALQIHKQGRAMTQPTQVKKKNGRR